LQIARREALPDPEQSNRELIHVQTGLISYRVADFLKQYPPFHACQEPDLLELAGRGRVKFHESDEFVCWQDTPFSPFLFVIQQGSVSLWQAAGSAEVLYDIRGPGDMIGVERFAGAERYHYSARTNDDVVIYALPAAAFESMLAKYGHVQRYVESHARAGLIHSESAGHGLHKRFIAELARTAEPLTCRPSDTIAAVARKMTEARATAVAVMDDHAFVGMVEAGGVLDWTAREGLPCEMVSRIMKPPPPTLAPQTLLSDCVLTLAGTETGLAALTTDGTSSGTLLRLISGPVVQPALGENPLNLLREIATAPGVEPLRQLHERARAFLLTHLTEPAAAAWLAELSRRTNIAILRRLLELSEETEPDWTWCFLGTAGRGELLTAAEPELAVICPGGSSVARADRALHRLRADLRECGYLIAEEPENRVVARAGTIREWQERFTAWIQNPVASGEYLARPLFDLKPAFGPFEPWKTLEELVRREIGKSAVFTHLLANDCLSTLPPLTFFAEYVVDESGERSELFEIETRALTPLVEVGRLLAMMDGNVLGRSTADRLRNAGAKRPADAAVFREAIETLEALHYLKARTGLRMHNRGAEIHPNQLSRMDRQALRLGFRAIYNLLRFAIDGRWW